MEFETEPSPQGASYYFTTADVRPVTPSSDGEEPSTASEPISEDTAFPQKHSRNQTSTVADQKAWDVFRLLPPKPDKIGYGFWHEASLQVLKLCTFVVLFILTLGSAVVAKSSFLLMTSAIGWGGMNMTICRDKIPGMPFYWLRYFPQQAFAVSESPLNTVFITNRLVVKWVWATFIRPFRSRGILLHSVASSNAVQKCKTANFDPVFFVETLHAIGVGILVFRIFPDLDAVTGEEPLSTSQYPCNSGLCFIPAILSLLSRRPSKIALVLVIIDIVAIAAQSSGFWAFPMFIPSLEKHSVAIPWCLAFISLAWWQNFVHNDSVFPPIRAMARFASRLSERRSKTYAVVSLWKICIYLLCMITFMSSRMHLNDLLQRDPFGEKLITITGHNLNQTQIDKFVARMSKYGGDDYEDVPPAPTTRKPVIISELAQEVDTGDYRGARLRRQSDYDDEEDLPSAYNVSFQASSFAHFSPLSWICQQFEASADFMLYAALNISQIF
ncbi:hypothetical protein COOONC_15875 [Cooperia oncophora]